MKPIYKITRTFLKPVIQFSNSDCYILGWFFSDAAVNSKSVRLRIQEKDRRLLIKIAQYLGYNGRIGVERRGTIGRLVTGCKCQNRATLNVTQKSFASPIHEMKAINEDYSDLFNTFSPSQKRAFIRGLLDGDGCVSYSTSSGMKFEVYWLLNPTFAVTVKNWFNSAGISSNIQLQSYLKPLARLSIKGNIKGLSLFNFLFSDAEIFLNRKFRKFVRLVNFKKCKNSELLVKRLFAIR